MNMHHSCIIYNNYISIHLYALNFIISSIPVRERKANSCLEKSRKSFGEPFTKRALGKKGIRVQIVVQPKGVCVYICLLDSLH